MYSLRLSAAILAVTYSSRSLGDEVKGGKSQVVSCDRRGHYLDGRRPNDRTSVVGGSSYF